MLKTLTSQKNDVIHKNGGYKKHFGGKMLTNTFKEGTRLYSLLNTKGEIK